MPGRPNATSVTYHNLKLNWTAPRKDGGSAVTKYLVQKKSAKDPTWVTVNSAVPGLACVVDDLDPETQYTFRVYAENDVGYSPPSQEIGSTTVGQFLRNTEETISYHLLFSAHISYMGKENI